MGKFHGAVSLWSMQQQQTSAKGISFPIWGGEGREVIYVVSELLHRVTSCSLEGTSNRIQGYLYLVLGGESFLKLLPRILVGHPIIQLEVLSREHRIISYL